MMLNVSNQHRKINQTMTTTTAKLFLPLLFLSLSLPSMLLSHHPTTQNSCNLESIVQETYTSISSAFESTVSEKIIDTFRVFQSPALGPESLIFGLNGEGPYTGVGDGRILKYGGPESGFVYFAYTSPYRTNKECDGTNDPLMGPKCGRPLGLGFNHKTNELYIADAFFGLCKVGPDGGLAKQLVTAADGLPLKWADGIDVDQTTQIVYFTDVTAKYSMIEMEELLANGDATGRLLSFDPMTKEVKVLISGIQGAAGVAISEDSSFVLCSEYWGGRILKYWLTGPKAGSKQVLISIPAPTSVKRTLSGDFWISSALHLQDPSPHAISKAVRINEFGALLQVFKLGGIYNNTLINDVQEYESSLYIGSAFLNFAAAAKI